MKYFDTDVLIHFFYNQDEIKHLAAIKLIENAMADNTFSVSWLNIQEIGFVLSKLKQTNEFIIQKLNDLITFNPLNYNKETFKRAIELSNHIGFSDFNDCLHLAIAEQQCSQLYTYNSRDFSKIKAHTNLIVNIL